VSLVVQQGLFLAMIGVLTGLAGALGMARFVSRLPFEVRWLLLFDVPPTDTLKFDSVSAILTIVAFLDSYVPARRAARVDPIVALRHE
jgi:putative ABC transport system permease protein